jgi:exodeoxyribonuclease V alpha subunit
MTQTVVVENVLWEGVQGRVVFNGTTLLGKRYRFLAWEGVMPRPPVAGEIWTISGTVKKHPEHGKQVQIDTAILEKPSGRLIVATISKSKNFPGIGNARAERLWNKLGETIYDLLGTENIQPISEIIGENLASVLMRGWEALSIETDVFRYLERYGLPFGISNKLITIYRNDVIAKFEENPYRLLAFTSWKQADKVARTIGVEPEDPRRLIAAVEAVGYRRIHLNHTITKQPEFRTHVRRLLRCDANTASKAIELALKDFAIVEFENGIQGIGPATMEKYIAERIKVMLAGEFEAKQSTIRIDPGNDLGGLLAEFETKERIDLNQAQREAVGTALEKPISIITGGAGVGKTTVLKAVHEASERLGGHIHQMALAGRAAKRMTEATGRNATTIMGFLKAVDAEKIKLDTEPTLVIDEASMVDLPTTYRIMRKMEPGCRLVLVGDPAQLPPIGFGLVFHALCNSNAIPRVELTKVHRQAESSGIPQISDDIRNGEVPELNEYRGRGVGVSFIDCAIDDIADTVLDITNDIGGIYESQIIGAVKNGPAGTKTINRLFHELLSPGRPERLTYAVGEPVIWTVNDYDLGLMNGSMGVVKKADEELEIDFDGIRISIPDETVGDMDLAYAITCHKSQGSQFGKVIIPVASSRIMDRTLLYTAITRAQDQVVLVGDRQAFEKAIVSPPNPDKRETGILHLLRSEPDYL